MVLPVRGAIARVSVRGWPEAEVPNEEVRKLRNIFQAKCRYRERERAISNEGDDFMRSADGLGTSCHANDLDFGQARAFEALDENKVKIMHLGKDLLERRFTGKDTNRRNLIGGDENDMLAASLGMSPSVLSWLIDFEAGVGMMFDRADTDSLAFQLGNQFFEQGGLASLRFADETNCRRQFGASFRG